MEGVASPLHGAVAIQLSKISEDAARDDFAAVPLAPIVQQA